MTAAIPEEFCSHVVDPVTGKRCGERYRLFDVYRREGTSMVFVDKPYVRCGPHTIEVVVRLAPWDYEHGYLDMVVRHGMDVGPQAKTLRR